MQSTSFFVFVFFIIDQSRHEAASWRVDWGSPNPNAPRGSLVARLIDKKNKNKKPHSLRRFLTQTLSRQARQDSST
jgi:hypothetical protein